MRNLHKKYQPFITLICRLLLGGVLLVAGGLKAFKPSESAGAVAAYKILPTNLAHLIGYALPWLEIAIGILLIIGLSYSICCSYRNRRHDYLYRCNHLGLGPWHPH